MDPMLPKPLPGRASPDLDDLRLQYCLEGYHELMILSGFLVGFLIGLAVSFLAYRHGHLLCRAWDAFRRLPPEKNNVSWSDEDDEEGSELSPVA